MNKKFKITRRYQKLVNAEKNMKEKIKKKTNTNLNNLNYNNNMQNSSDENIKFTQNLQNSVINDSVTNESNINDSVKSQNSTSNISTSTSTIMKKKQKTFKVNFLKEDQSLVLKYEELLPTLSTKEVEMMKEFLLKKHITMKTEHTTKDRISIPIQMDKRILEELKIFYPDNVSEQNISVLSDFINEATKKLFITILKEFLKEFNEKNEELKKNI